MKNITLVLINNGSNCGTYSPHCFLESFTRNLNQKTYRCLSFDDDRQVETDLYSTATISIPEWMTEFYYLQNCIAYHWASAMTNGWSNTLNMHQFNRLMPLDETYKYFLGLLFKGNTKNAFKSDMRAKVIEWFDAETSKFDRPLSPAQFDVAAKYMPLYEARKISNRLYESKYYWLA